MKNFTLLSLIGTFVCLACASCEIINPDEQIPSYVYITPAKVNNLIGKSETGIAAYHLFINDQSIGVYEPESSDTIPVLAEGTTKIEIQPFIWRNGISADAQPSPLHTHHIDNEFEFSVDAITTIDPTFEYAPSLFNEDLPFNQDFNSSSNFIIVSGSNSALPNTTSLSSEVFEGTRSLKVLLDDNKPSFNIQNGQAFGMDKFADAIYLEMMYKCDQIFTVKLDVCCDNGVAFVADVINISPKDDWNRIFIELTDEVRLFEISEDRAFKIQFEATKPDDVETATFFFDEIRILEREF